ncbi:MAG: respiratory nitrate reductase subunit gamma [Deltaproteobacteria bacterium]|nr:respiratory nitrate reductase subunit gamma [Deltaproteobacteria bacterium]
MHDLYNFVTGPLAWAAFIVFIAGSLYRLINMFYLVNKKEKFIFTYMSFKYSFRSIFHWIIPFATTNWKMHPVLTIVTFAFHICLIITPVFLLSHTILWDESWNISLWSLSDGVADIMTLVVVGSCIFFLVRRLVLQEVQYVTSASDYVILAIVAAPFVTGFIAYHQWVNYQFFMILHIISGEIMLVAIPFTRLSHMLFSPFTRAYMGSEFGGVRNAKDW